MYVCVCVVDNVALGSLDFTCFNFSHLQIIPALNLFSIDVESKFGNGNFIILSKEVTDEERKAVKWLTKLHLSWLWEL